MCSCFELHAHKALRDCQTLLCIPGSSVASEFPLFVFAFGRSTTDQEEKNRKIYALDSFFGGGPSQKQPKLNFEIPSKEEHHLQEAARDLEYNTSNIKAEAAIKC